VHQKSKDDVCTAAVATQPVLSSSGVADSPVVSFAAQNSKGNKKTVELPCKVGEGPKRKQRRPTSCPLRPYRSSVSGLWSLKRLTVQHHSEAGAISSSRKVVNKGVRSKEGLSKGQGPHHRRKKVDGVMCHNVHSLKKVARLPNQDRSEVMKFLKKHGRKYHGSSKLKKAVTMISNDLSYSTSSSSSINNDLKHWVILHWSEKVAREDVMSIGTVTPRFPRIKISLKRIACIRVNTQTGHHIS